MCREEQRDRHWKAARCELLCHLDGGEAAKRVAEEGKGQADVERWTERLDDRVAQFVEPRARRLREA